MQENNKLKFIDSTEGTLSRLAPIVLSLLGTALGIAHLVLSRVSAFQISFDQQWMDGCPINEGILYLKNIHEVTIIVTVTDSVIVGTFLIILVLSLFQCARRADIKNDRKLRPSTFLTFLCLICLCCSWGHSLKTALSIEQMQSCSNTSSQMKRFKSITIALCAIAGASTLMAILLLIVLVHRNYTVTREVTYNENENQLNQLKEQSTGNLALGVQSKEIELFISDDKGSHNQMFHLQGDHLTLNVSEEHSTVKLGNDKYEENSQSNKIEQNQSKQSLEKIPKFKKWLPDFREAKSNIKSRIFKYAKK